MVGPAFRGNIQVGKLPQKTLTSPHQNQPSKPPGLEYAIMSGGERSTA